MARVIRQDVQSTHGYAIQPSAGLIKLDAMENPFRLPERLQRALGERLARVAINRYPVQCAVDVAAALSRHVELPTGCKLMLGNGSDELIDMLSVACNVKGAAILAPEPGFVMYRMSAQLRGLRFVGVPLTPEFELDEAAMLAAIERERPALTYIAYPNNPTANLWDDAVIDRIVHAVGAQDGLVVFDEAYQPFSSRSWMQRMAAHDHVLVMRTLSKFGLAGVRLGYLCGRAALIDEVEKVRPPYNVSVLNAEATLFALEHADEYARQAVLLRTERERLQAVLRTLRGARAYPSEANMILLRVPDSKRAFEGLKARGVLVKHVAGLHPLLAKLPAHHDRHAGREWADDRSPESESVDGRARRRSPARHQRNEDPRAVSTSTAPAWRSCRQASASSTTCSTSWRATASSTLRSTRRAICTSTATTRSRMWASRSAWRSRRRSATRRASRATATLRAARRGAVACGDRLLGPPGAPHARALQGRDGGRLRHPARLRVLPGLRQPCDGDAAHRQPARRQCAPPVRDRVQGVRAGAAHGARGRPAQRRGRAVDQGQPVVRLVRPLEGVR
jgi:histidinol-phosphate aminotransferase